MSPPRASRTDFFAASTAVTSSRTTLTPWRSRPSMLRVMSSMRVNPARTRFEIGHEMKLASRSTSTTSMDGSHIRMYFAAVAPPKPPPTTTTRALDGTLPAHPARPASEPAAANLRKSRLSMALPLLPGEPRRQRVDLRIGVALGDLVHHRRLALAVAQCAHLRRDVLARQAGERYHLLGHAASCLLYTSDAADERS